MKQENTKRKITTLLLLSLAIILIAAGCGKTGVSSTDLNNYVDGNSSTPNSASDIIEPVTLSWSEPSFNADGTPLTGDLAGYIIYYGQGTDNYTDSVDIGHFTSASVSDLTYGTWCFTVTAYDAAGNESDFSEEICKTIS